MATGAGLGFTTRIFGLTGASYRAQPPITNRRTRKIRITAPVLQNNSCLLRSLDAARESRYPADADFRTIATLLRRGAMWCCFGACGPSVCFAKEVTHGKGKENRPGRP